MIPSIINGSRADSRDNASYILTINLGMFLLVTLDRLLVLLTACLEEFAIGLSLLYNT